MCNFIYNSEVLKIQRILNRLKIYDEKNNPLKEDGLVNESYYFAVEKLQNILDISPKFEKDMEILKKLEFILTKPTLKVGDENFVVRYLQWFLQIDVSGRFDIKTEAKVVKFQSKNRVATNGRVEIETWSKIIGQSQYN